MTFFSCAGPTFRSISSPSLKNAEPENEAGCVIRGRRILPADVQTVRELLSQKPDLGRWGLALELCQRWQWRTAHGDWKGRAAVAVLAGLAERGWIELPASSRSRSPGPVRGPKAEGWPSQVLEGPLSQYRPLHWELVQTAPQRQRWRQLLDAYHYLRAPGMVGANLKYFVYGSAGQLLAALGWQSAVAHLGCRNRLLAWSLAQRALYLDRLVNNVRFLLLPWVKVPCLASVILSEGVRRLERDWPQRYGRPVWWVESFVDRQRFAASSYRGADWQVIGWTRGFAKRPEGFVQHGQTKEVYVWVLEPRMRRLIHGDDQQPLLTRPFLLAQRGREEQQLAKRMRLNRILASWKPALPPPCQPRVAELARVGPELSAFSALFHPAFGRVELRQWLELHLQERLSQAEGKKLAPLRRRLENPAQMRNFQRFLTDYRWDESWLAQRHWQLAAEALSDPQGVWSIDAKPFPKQGPTFVGVAWQEGGALGQRVHGQLGIFLGYSSPKGHTLLESRLYLPQCWFESEFQERRRRCRIPEETTFQTQGQLALELLSPLWKSQQFGGRWIACDGSLGNQEGFLEHLPKDCYYLAEITGTRQVWVKQTDLSETLKTQGCPVAHLLQLKALLNWQTHLLSEKGPIRAAWARVRVYLSAPPTVQSERWLLLRQEANGQTHYALSNAPEEIPLTQLVQVSRARWPVERCFQEGQSQLGLGPCEHRSWTAWHRHRRLAFLAQLFVLRLQRQCNQPSGLELAASTPGPGPSGAARIDPAALFPNDPQREPP